MIEPTGEMLAAFRAEREDWCDEIGCGRDDCLTERLTAVLRIVERDYLKRPAWMPPATPTCAETLETKGTVVRCAKQPNHLDNAHLARHEGWDVIW